MKRILIVLALLSLVVLSGCSFDFGCYEHDTMVRIVCERTLCECFDNPKCKCSYVADDCPIGRAESVNYFTASCVYSYQEYMSLCLKNN